MINITPDYDLFALGERVTTVSCAPAEAPKAGTVAKKTAQSGASAARPVRRPRTKSTLELDRNGGPSGPMIFDGGPSGPMLFDGGPSGPMLYDGGPSGPMLV